MYRIRNLLHIQLHFSMQSFNLLSRSSTPVFLNDLDTNEDTLARESDVTVSTNVTLYAEYRGFFIYVFSTVLLTVFVGWSLIPDNILQYLGINYYPDKYWTHAIPAWLLMLMLYTYFYVALYNTEVLTFPIDDVRLFTDEHSVFPKNPEEWVWKAPSGVWDMPIGLVNEVLYLDE